MEMERKSFEAQKAAYLAAEAEREAVEARIKEQQRQSLRETPKIQSPSESLANNEIPECTSETDDQDTLHSPDRIESDSAISSEQELDQDEQFNIIEYNRMSA